MKVFNILFVLVLSFSQSCQGQEKENTVSLDYSARTRGFQYSLLLKNNVLNITKNGEISTLELSKEQLSDINTLISKIDFTKIESELSEEKAAVDRVIPAKFNLQFNKKEYNYNFEHNNSPSNLQELLNYLENLTNLKE